MAVEGARALRFGLALVIVLVVAACQPVTKPTSVSGASPTGNYQTLYDARIKTAGKSIISKLFLQCIDAGEVSSTTYQAKRAKCYREKLLTVVDQDGSIEPKCNADPSERDFLPCVMILGFLERFYLLHGETFSIADWRDNKKNAAAIAEVIIRQGISECADTASASGQPTVCLLNGLSERLGLTEENSRFCSGLGDVGERFACIFEAALTEYFEQMDRML